MPDRRAVETLKIVADAAANSTEAMAVLRRAAARGDDVQSVACAMIAAGVTAIVSIQGRAKAATVLKKTWKAVRAGAFDIPTEGD